jgi:hypothetical protein
MPPKPRKSTAKSPKRSQKKTPKRKRSSPARKRGGVPPSKVFDNELYDYTHYENDLYDLPVTPSEKWAMTRKEFTTRQNLPITTDDAWARKIKEFEARKNAQKRLYPSTKK